jgi:hypothetical protein
MLGLRTWSPTLRLKGGEEGFGVRNWSCSSNTAYVKANNADLISPFLVSEANSLSFVFLFRKTESFNGSAGLELVSARAFNSRTTFKHVCTGGYRVPTLQLSPFTALFITLRQTSANTGKARREFVVRLRRVSQRYASKSTSPYWTPIVIR